MVRLNRSSRHPVYCVKGGTIKTATQVVGVAGIFARARKSYYAELQDVIAKIPLKPHEWHRRDEMRAFQRIGSPLSRARAITFSSYHRAYLPVQAGVATLFTRISRKNEHTRASASIEREYTIYIMSELSLACHSRCKQEKTITMIMQRVD